MLKPDITAQIIIFGEASKFQEVSDFLQQNYPKSNILILDKNRLNSEELDKLEFSQNESVVIYIEQEHKADFGIKAAFLDKAINAKAAIFTLPLQNWKKNEFNFNEFQLQDLYKIDEISPSKLPQKNKKLLVTGGAGYIGAALVKYYSASFSEIIIIDQSESALFFLKEEVEILYPNAKINCCLADVTNRQRMTGIFEEFQPEIVIHAAAYKHVSLLENELEEVIKNNIAGAYILFYLAETFKAEQCILLSTDKAVAPKSIMGKSKLWAEKLCSWFSQVSDETRFKTIRFGNVLGSTGSVLPVWKKQLEWRNSSINLTDVNASRYFFTLQEVFDLTDVVLESEYSGKIFTRINEHQVSIKTLANLYLYNRSAEIRTTELKPGEKEHEQLIAESENIIEQDSHFVILKNAEIKDDFPEELNLLLSDKMLLQDKKSIFENYKV
ncbi:polysaccharide biosynthesis protein [Zunongwangia atlantica]|uniref:Capsular polysaccharide biosynthesis protein CapD n=1 Tax=Zunongwangia atlantica 22II14-10F7 TaxID=1185767 RepID=A0A1Y1T8I8_9FLAO|nr:polysaccharide biosynthesis protein [Zunongwangia atlantica]ORL46875.1 capsular polysaccharide biosynthesis protein CapD [Zunongwangia atlantica 22II14-10F7]